MIYDGPGDKAKAKRIDLTDEAKRKQVAEVTSHAHLKQLFDASS